MEILVVVASASISTAAPVEAVAAGGRAATETAASFKKRIRLAGPAHHKARSASPLTGYRSSEVPLCIIQNSSSSSDIPSNMLALAAGGTAESGVISTERSESLASSAHEIGRVESRNSSIIVH